MMDTARIPDGLVGRFGRKPVSVLTMESRQALPQGRGIGEEAAPPLMKGS